MATTLERARRLKYEAEEEGSFEKADQAVHLYQQAIREASFGAQRNTVIFEQGDCYQLKQKLEQEKKIAEATAELRKRSRAERDTGAVAAPTAADTVHYEKKNTEATAELRERNRAERETGAVATPTAADTVHQAAVPLTISGVTDVCDILKKAGFKASKWESLAARLGISDPGSITHHDPDLCLQEVLRQWIHSNKQACTWEKLATEVSKVHGYGEGTKQAILDLAKRGIQQQATPMMVGSVPGAGGPMMKDPGFTGAGRGHPSSSDLHRRPVHHTNGEGGHVTNGGQAGRGYGNGTSQRMEQEPPSHAVQTNGNAQRVVPHQGTPFWVKVGLIVVVVMICGGSYAGYQYVTSLARKVPQPGPTPGSQPRTTQTHTDPGPTPDTITDCHPIRDTVDLMKALADIGDWESLCHNLRVKDATMAGLRVSRDPEVNKKWQCLKAYIDQGDACWEEVIKVVADYPFFNVKLARDIAEKHGIDHSRLLDEL